MKTKQLRQFIITIGSFTFVVQAVTKKSMTKSHISKFSQLYSIGTGGDFDYADSQILFNKSIDLANILTNKY